MPEPFLQARLCGRAGAVVLDVSFALTKPWTVLFGASGAGKSTIVRTLAGTSSLADESITVEGRDMAGIPTHRRGIALVAQQPALFPHLTALENVAFAAPSREAARDHLRTFRADAVADRYPTSISGGEQQRVALARAVASSPRLLLLDEAFTGLGLAMRTEMIGEMKAWQRSSCVPVLSVTHDVAEAFACADEVLRLENGRITAQGPPAQVLDQERNSLLNQLKQ